MRRFALAAVVTLVTAAPVLAVDWGYDMHQGIQSIGMRNDSEELFAFVCGGFEQEILGVDIELATTGHHDAQDVHVRILDTPRGVVAPKTVFEFDAKLDEGDDVASISAYDFTQEQADELIAFLATSPQYGVEVPELQTTAIFDVSGGYDLWTAPVCDE